LVALWLCAGCGSRYIVLNLDRPASLSQPAWVGVYFLSQELALDGMEDVQLVDPDGIDVGDAIIDKEVYPLYPGGPARKIELKDFDPAIRWVVIAAGLPDDPPCARKTVPVEENAELTLSVTVGEDCVVIDIE
jgi:hypothetical protein